jgi:hypothetical protein
MKAARHHQSGAAFAFACQAKHLKRQNKEAEKIICVRTHQAYRPGKACLPVHKKSSGA